jgi:hypothetical protein
MLSPVKSLPLDGRKVWAPGAQNNSHGSVWRDVDSGKSLTFRHQFYQHHPVARVQPPRLHQISTILK